MKTIAILIPTIKPGGAEKQEPCGSVSILRAG